MPILSRICFVLVAWSFSELLRHVYIDVIAGHAAFALMGARVLSATAAVQGAFIFLAVLPATWLTVHMRRPTDAVQLFLYYAVHIPTCVMLPIVSQTSHEDQFIFAIAILLGLLSLDLRYLLPRLRVPQPRLEPGIFWYCIATFYVFSFIIFAKSGHLSVWNISLLEVYDQRLELGQRASEIGKTFFYVANWAGAAVAPFVIIAGLHKRRLLLVLAGVVLAGGSFVASSNKLNYIGVPAVIVSYAVFRKTEGRHIAVMMGVGFTILTLGVLWIDRSLETTSGAELPSITWAVVHRLFTNNGFLSAVYLDVFHQWGPAFYSDSFLRWLPVPRLDAPVPILAAESFTEIPDVWANAHLWADGYANLGYAGIAFSTLSALLVLWVYDSVSARKNNAVAAAALVVPASVLANTSVHTALISNGMLVAFLLIWLWRGGDCHR